MSHFLFVGLVSFLPFPSVTVRFLFAHFSSSDIGVFSLFYAFDRIQNTQHSTHNTQHTHTHTTSLWSLSNLSLFVNAMSLSDAFADLLPAIFRRGSRGGGREPTQPHMRSLDLDSDSDSLPDKPYLQPCKDNEARVTIVQVTDVYTLDNFASLKTLLKTIRAAQGSDEKSNRVVSMLTGDFLSPYLLSSLDRGAGMMSAITETPIDILTWGNHEADIDHKAVCKHVRKFPGIWINSNMQDHAEMKHQVPYHIIEVTSEDGSHKHKVGLVAVLSNDKKLYAHHKSPAFGGATIEDPWETLRKYEKLLKEEEGCDLVIPLEHLYVPENHKTCNEFDFPLILSGHDHHRIDEVVNGTRLIKPGMDGIHATVLELIWDTTAPAGSIPKIRSSFVEVGKWEADPELKKKTDAAYEVLAPLRNTELVGVLASFQPLSSRNSRGEVCTMGRLICSMLKTSLEQNRDPGQSRVDAVVLMGGNIRGGEDYENGSYFSLEMLESETKSDETIGVVPIPGDVLAKGIEVTHAGDPISGWMQYDEGVEEEDTPDGKRVTKVAGKPLEPTRIYNVATKISDLTNDQSPPLKEYFLAHPELYPAKGDYINVQSELMGFFSRNLWRRLWDATGEQMPTMEESGADDSEDSSSETEMESRLRLAVLDRDGDGLLTVDDIHFALKTYLGLSVHDEEKTLAEYVYSYADVSDDGVVTVDDFEYFCTGLPREMRALPKKWRSSIVFPSPIPTDDPEASV
jgi:2',3'-cyclic-nucleotide 2'-phosphodiesterase (5'-nucleotidase family)